VTRRPLHRLVAALLAGCAVTAFTAATTTTASAAPPDTARAGQVPAQFVPDPGGDWYGDDSGDGSGDESGDGSGDGSEPSDQATHTEGVVQL
jgi:hypothetical protein